MKKILVFAVVIFVGYASLSDYISNFSLDNVLEPATPNGSAPPTIEPTTIEPTTLPTTETGNKDFSAGTWCAGKLSEKENEDLTEPFQNNGIAAGLVPSWDDKDRCLSAEIISRLSQNKKINDGKPGNRNAGATCSARTGDQQFFPSADPAETSSWFFDPLEPCQEISGRKFRNCTMTSNVTSEIEQKIRNGDQNQLIDSGCIFSPDGRLVIENIAPIWDSKTDVQTLVYSPQIKPRNKDLTEFTEFTWALPANGCLTLRTNSECKKDATGLTLYGDELNAWQSCLIKSATRRIGALYGRGNAKDEEGLTGINNAEKIGKQNVTFDCVALAYDLGVEKVLNLSTNGIFAKAKMEENFWDKVREAKSWKDVATTLPIGTLLSTNNHLSIVVGYLERENKGFHPIVVEAENFLVGIVRAKIKDVANLDKYTRTVLVSRKKCK